MTALQTELPQLKVISTAEVKKHRNKEDGVWMIIHDDVYDVTSFLEEHPGGEDSLLDSAGKEATQDFEDVGHSDDARELMKKYLIGTLPPDEKTTPDLSPGEHFNKDITCCSHLPKSQKMDKSWRTYDGSPSSRSIESAVKPDKPFTPRPEARLQAIRVPLDTRRPRPLCPPPPPSSKLKWALLALAGAVVLGIVLKKYLNK